MKSVSEIESTVYKRFEPQPDLVRRFYCQPYSATSLVYDIGIYIDTDGR
jgi:hypothetical protein